ncbi:cadherin-86C [Caerostris extrusa]|uniref:Cadherin-86C n=1 Tax=Caerostris extrusa TaxID=172846 RepID=A0AAV4P5H0_CAEEX|nr:cadherin-86C [Caerostris extrusa]
MFQSIPVLLMALFTTAAGVAPTIDLSHNMRILKLPRDTKPGSIIYRLRGSDPDPGDILTFGVRGDVGNQLLNIVSVTETRANVFLKEVPTEKEYQLTIYVTDGTQTTEVESTIIITNATNHKSPFLEYESLISVSELTEEKEVIGSVVVRKRNSSSLPVLFELEGSEKFAIRYLISPLKEASKAEIFLLQKLDYEKKNLYTISIFALNPWTDEEVDTRNVAVLPILVAVKDAQDTPPIFQSLPPVVRVSDSLPLNRDDHFSFVHRAFREAYSTTGPFVLSIQATELETELIPGLPASSVATLAVVLVNTENKPPRFLSRRYVGSVEENSPGLTLSYGKAPKRLEWWTMINVKWPPSLVSLCYGTQAYSICVTICLKLLRFLKRRYVRPIEENIPGFTPIIWGGFKEPREARVKNSIQNPVNERNSKIPCLIHLKALCLPESCLGLLNDIHGIQFNFNGKNGSFELFLEDDDGAFSVQPSRGMNELNFALLVKDPTKLDYETSDTKYIEFRIVARETASVRPLSATAEIRVKLQDANDNIPQFTHDIYNVTLPEDAPAGTTLVKIQATDEDSGSYGVVRYTAVNGPIAGNLRLDPVTGELTLLSGEGLDRERIPEYTLTVEARDDQGKGNRNMAEVHITLADANDNAPLFLQPRYDAVLNPDMRNFYEPLRVQAYDADGAGPNSDVTYEIVNGNYQEKFLIEPHTGELSLQAPLVPNPETQDHGLPVITLTVRAHDQGVPVRFATVKVQVHNQEYLNRSISFVIPISVKKASERRQELERSVVRCWVSYPLSSTVDLSNMEAIIRNLFGSDHYLASTTKVESISRNSFDVVFWLLIALVILMILAILALFFYCCCVKAVDGPDSRTRSNWIENQQSQVSVTQKNHVRTDEERPSPNTELSKLQFT